MRLISTSTAALLLCLSTAALAGDDTAAASSTPSEDSQAEKPKKVCRMETVTGSVMPKRVCRTAAQADADAEAARRTREQMGRNRSM